MGVVMSAMQSFCAVAQLTGERFPKLKPGAEEADFGVGFTQAQGLGSFLDRKAFNVPQQENQPMFFVQLSQGFIQEPLSFVSLHECLRGLSPVRDVFRVGYMAIVIAGLCCSLPGNHFQPFSFADYFQGGMSSDPEQPGGKARITPKPA